MIRNIAPDMAFSPARQTSTPVRKHQFLHHSYTCNNTLGHTCLVGQYFNMQGTVLCKIIANVSFPASSIAPSNTMKTSWQGENCLSVWDLCLYVQQPNCELSSEIQFCHVVTSGDQGQGNSLCCLETYRASLK